MSTQIYSVTIQAALFSALSTSLAQALTMYQQQKFAVDPISFLKFIIIAICTTPPNYIYQRWLEDTFPARPSPQKLKSDTDVTEGKLSKSNTLTKFLLDQTIGAAANTAVFIVLIGLLGGKSFAQTRGDINQNFVSMLTAGWRMWPMVTLLNLVVVPFEYRHIVGNTAGVLWGVYMNLKTV